MWATSEFLRSPGISESRWNLNEPKWGRMASCGRSSTGRQPAWLLRNSRAEGRLKIGWQAISLPHCCLATFLDIRRSELAAWRGRRRGDMRSECAYRLAGSGVRLVRQLLSKPLFCCSTACCRICEMVYLAIERSLPEPSESSYPFALPLRRPSQSRTPGSQFQP
jgi:hypothetical protein